MSSLTDHLLGTLVLGAIQLTLFGGFLLGIRRASSSFTPAAFCHLAIFILFITILPESFFLSGATRFTRFDDHLGTAIVGIWAIGFFALFLVIVFRVVRNHRVLVQVPMVTHPEMIHLLERLKETLSLWVPVALYESRIVSSPMLYGWVRPRIFLPALGAGETSDDAECILAHECVHVQRRDILWQWIATLLVLVFWFHPFAWMLLRRYREDREMACDDTVVRRLGFDPDRYAGALVNEARRASDPVMNLPFPVYAGIVEKRSLLQSRIEHIMKPKNTSLARHLVTAAAVCAVLLSTVFLTRAAAEPERVVTEAEKRTIEKRAETILEAIWDRTDTMGGYEYASEYYKKEITPEKYKELIESPQVAAITIESRDLVEVTEVKGENAVPGGTNILLQYRTAIEGVEIKWNESLYMMEEDGDWFMTGHFIRP